MHMKEITQYTIYALFAYNILMTLIFNDNAGKSYNNCTVCLESY